MTFCWPFILYIHKSCCIRRPAGNKSMSSPKMSWNGYMIVPRSWGGKTQAAQSSNHISDALAFILPGSAFIFHLQAKERDSRAESCSLMQKRNRHYKSSSSNSGEYHIHFDNSRKIQVYIDLARHPCARPAAIEGNISNGAKCNENRCVKSVQAPFNCWTWTHFTGKIFNIQQPRNYLKPRCNNTGG